jgi:proton-dependent oligopeptide transporter, POT family
MTDADVPDVAPVSAALPARRQPPGTYLLAGVEMWERFSYYGMRAFLIFYLTSNIGGFGWSKEKAGVIFGLYGWSVYIMPLLGGYLADKFLGTHRAVIIGSFFIAAGHFTLAAPGQVAFFLGLFLIAFGTGFHKSNISTMVGQQFAPGDRRRDPAFTIFHVGINVGAFLGPIICGRLAQSPRFGWHWGFASAGVGMVVGTIIYILLKRRLLGTIGNVPGSQVKNAAGGLAGDQPLTKDERDRIWAIVILSLFNIFFWTAYEQTGSSMNFFARERTDLLFLGITFAPSDFQSVNPFTIMICGPLFAVLWTKLAARGRDPTTTNKFVMGLVLVALGFAVMVLAAARSDGGLKVSPLYLISALVLHTWGELCLYPVGLSAVTKLAPAKFGALMMGLFFGSLAISELLAGVLSGQVEKIERGQVFQLLGGQADFFLVFVVVPGLGALVLWLISGKVTKLMHGRA